MNGDEDDDDTFGFVVPLFASNKPKLKSLGFATSVSYLFDPSRARNSPSSQQPPSLLAPAPPADIGSDETDSRSSDDSPTSSGSDEVSVEKKNTSTISKPLLLSVKYVQRSELQQTPSKPQSQSQVIAGSIKKSKDATLAIQHNEPQPKPQSATAAGKRKRNTLDDSVTSADEDAELAAVVEPTQRQRQQQQRKKKAKQSDENGNSDDQTTISTTTTTTTATPTATTESAPQPAAISDATNKPSGGKGTKKARAPKADKGGKEEKEGGDTKNKDEQPVAKKQPTKKRPTKIKDENYRTLNMKKRMTMKGKPDNAKGAKHKKMLWMQNKDNRTDRARYGYREEDDDGTVNLNLIQDFDEMSAASSKPVNAVRACEPIDNESTEAVYARLRMAAIAKERGGSVSDGASKASGDAVADGEAAGAATDPLAPKKKVYTAKQRANYLKYQQFKHRQQFKKRR